MEAGCKPLTKPSSRPATRTTHQPATATRQPTHNQPALAVGAQRCPASHAAGRARERERRSRTSFFSRVPRHSF